METTIEQMRQDLTLAGYAKTTQASYLRTVRQYQAHFGRPIPQITREEVRKFVAGIMTRERSDTWKRMELAGLAFLYRKTLGRPDMVSFISWPSSPSPLPTVLSMEEVEMLLHAIDHPVYHAIAVVLYGTGLRVSEALALEVRDIDGARKVVRVRHGKGNKPREVGLSPSLYEWLQRYWKRQRPPKPYVFAMPRTGQPPSASAVCHVLHLATKRTSIRKHVTPHVLRHCYATHMLEAGIDIRVVQELLGHASITSTLRYTRVTAKLVNETPSPIDLLPSNQKKR